MPPPDSSLVRIDGPWEHRMVAANGARFHVATLGQGPLVVLLHGFPLFWWTWRRQLVALAERGYHAVAVDLRGYGASDKPPRGYDPFTLSRDVAGIIRSLGAREAVVAGHGLGGYVAWSMAVITPEVVRAVAPVSAAHPRRLRAALPSNPRQARASARALPFQVPVLPERRLTAHRGAAVVRMLHDWSADGWPDQASARRFAEAFGIPSVAHCALEFHRWAFRSVPRPDGLRFAARMREPIGVPVLHIHGAQDPVVLERTAAGSERYVRAPYSWHRLEGVGHFPQEEAPDTVTSLLGDWLATLS